MWRYILHHLTKFWSISNLCHSWLIHDLLKSLWVYILYLLSFLSRVLLSNLRWLLLIRLCRSIYNVIVCDEKVLLPIACNLCWWISLCPWLNDVVVKTWISTTLERILVYVLLLWSICSNLHNLNLLRLLLTGLSWVQGTLLDDLRIYYALALPFFFLGWLLILHVSTRNLKLVLWMLGWLRLVIYLQLYLCWKGVLLRRHHLLLLLHFLKL